MVARPALRPASVLPLQHPGRFAWMAASLSAGMALLSAATAVTGLGGALQPVLFTALIFGALHLGAGHRARWRTTVACGLPAAAVAHGVVPQFPAFGLLVCGALAGWAAGAGVKDAVTRISVLLGVTLATILAALVPALQPAFLLALLPAPVLALAAGALQGGLIVGGVLPRYLTLGRDPLEDLFDEYKLLPGPELRDYLDRSMRVYRQIRRLLGDGVFPAREAEAETFRENLTQLMSAMFRLARRWHDIALFLEQADPDGTTARLRNAELKMAALTDAYARQQYQQVADSLKRRLDQLEEMRAGRERLLGSLSFYFTTLEEMHLSLVRLKASDAQSASLELNALAERVRSLNGELDATARSMQELDFGSPPDRLPA